MARVVFDASAVIALLRGEPGSALIADHVGDAMISAVNLQEVIKALLVRGISIALAREMIDALHLEVRAHTELDAYQAAALYPDTAHQGSGLGDRTCLALAIREGLEVITTDRAWAALNLPGLRVVLAR
jgi:PIN domain nuclease of toxin-antitoxin system